MTLKRLVIVGCGGLGLEVLWAVRRREIQIPDRDLEILGFSAEFHPTGVREIAGLPFLGLTNGNLMELDPIAPTHYICAVGDNQARKRICAILEAMGLKPFSVIDPAVVIGPEVDIGQGVYIGAGSTLSPGSRIGHHVVVNHACSIGLDSTLGNFSQACPGTRILGSAEIGEGAILGSNSVVDSKVIVGDWSTLGAASLASQNVPPMATALGVPAKIVFQRKPTPTCSESL